MKPCPSDTCHAMELKDVSPAKSIPIRTVAPLRYAPVRTVMTPQSPMILWANSVDSFFWHRRQGIPVRTVAPIRQIKQVILDPKTGGQVGSKNAHPKGFGAWYDCIGLSAIPILGPFLAAGACDSPKATLEAQATVNAAWNKTADLAGNIFSPVGCIPKPTKEGLGCGIFQKVSQKTDVISSLRACPQYECATDSAIVLMAALGGFLILSKMFHVNVIA